MSSSRDGDTLSGVPGELVGSGGKRAVQVSVVIPALNEARNLPHVLNRIPADVFEIIVVDGGSVDDTVAAARRTRPGITVIRQARSGKGNALATGFAVCRGDYVVMIDADGSMDPGEIGRFVAALEAGADYVKGSRFLAAGGSTDLTVLRRLGNRALTVLLNALYGTRCSDLCYGYNACRRCCIPAFRLPDPADPTRPSRLGDGFEIETLLTLRIVRSGLSVREVPSFESRRLSGRSNLHTFRDGSRVLAVIVRERLRRARRRAAEGWVADAVSGTDGGLGATG
ncbi:glycosyltransferase family 2 protein [Actinoplanes sp. NPDC049681]|uniref:glycosyltransferase family 2 protein n=1 Tax=Actinoplanes sp. NPDC049681 TaxID=3363905 RepID=UPI00379353C1